MMQMKTILFLLSLCLFRGELTAQNTGEAPYLKNQSIPEFRILQKDSLHWYTLKDLKPNKPVMFMLFSPDCDHCQKQTKLLTDHMKELGDLQIIMTTYQPLEKMKRFYQEYRIASYPNILMGRDVPYFFGPFFKAQSIPFLAIYNKQHKLARVYDGGAKMDKLLEALKL
jgi:thiol-disulfide isomerase/thioredoxin